MRSTWDGVTSIGGTGDLRLNYSRMNQILTEIDTIAADAKLASGLVYIPGLETGITRRMGARGFLHYRPDGRRISEASEIARLNSLAIPPAYTNVVISTNPFSHLQAIGTDARRQRQYRYHADWHAERGKAKFDRLGEFAERLPDLRERVDAGLRSLFAWAGAAHIGCKNSRDVVTRAIRRPRCALPRPRRLSR
jgi:hypothetical protein